jgi:phosphate transport system ATP-binding protein
MVNDSAKIRVENLKAWYGQMEVIHGISFDVQPNEIFGIIGPAQSGKTTLLKTLNRTLEFTAGSRMQGLVEMDGQDVYKFKDVYGYRRRVGMVAPLPVGLPLSIYDNVAFAPRSFGLKDKGTLHFGTR